MCMAFMFAITLRAHCDQYHPSVMNSETPAPHAQNRLQRRGFQISFHCTTPPMPVTVELVVHTAHEQHQRLPTDQDVLYIGKERARQLCNKAYGPPSFDDDVGSKVCLSICPCDTLDRPMRASGPSPLFVFHCNHRGLLFGNLYNVVNSKCLIGAVTEA